ncbi:MAG: penicillin-binding protein [Bacteroidia bacterium]|nr:transpeptidase family protein [Bacteroidia bacterium]MDW8157671.1 penicillin-binding protein [Bacteroidia bacterium]
MNNFIPRAGIIHYTRVYIVFSLCIIFGILILGKVLKLQIWDKEKLLSLENQKRVYTKVIQADRGSILSDDGSLLATSLSYYRLAVDITVLREQNFINLEDSLEALCTKLGEHFKKEGFSREYFQNLFYEAKKSKDRHVYLPIVNRLFDYNEMKQISAFPIFNRGRYEGGLIIEKENSKRFYPMDNLCRVTLGALAPNGKGAKGLEYAFDRVLAGVDGKKLVQRVARNLEISLNDIFEVEAKDGRDIQTTINVHLQDIVSSALENGVKRNKAQSGVAILMEVQSGEIKAIANYPENYNYAVMQLTEPGSTFKIATAIAAIENKIIDPDEIIDAENGKKKYYDRVMEDEKPHQKLTFQEAIEKSSNIVISKVIHNHYKDNPSLFIEHLSQTGVFRKSEIQLKGEPEPYVKKPENQIWDGTTLPWLAIGYGVKLTPMQILTFFNAIANDGKMIRPLLVKRILNKATVENTFHSSILQRNICSPATLEFIKKALEGVVEKGTAKNIRDPFYRIAGKTGTSQIFKQGQYTQLYQSSFVGYFPADNPKYSCIVLINEPTGGAYYGSEVAAPIFKEIADRVYTIGEQKNYREIQVETPEEPVISLLHYKDAECFFTNFGYRLPPIKKRRYSNFIRARLVHHSITINNYRWDIQTMPNLTGFSPRDAIYILEGIGLKAKFVGIGKIFWQSIPAGEKVKRGQIVVFKLGG